MTEHDAIVSNEYGSVFSDRVSFRSKKGWFGGGVLEELPMRHVTSVRFETSRNWVLGILCVLLGVFALSVPQGQGVVAGILFVAIGVLLLWGAPKVTLNTAGGDLRPATGAPWTQQAAKEFPEGVRRALFARE